MANNERSFIMIKPEMFPKGLVGEVIKRFEQDGYKLEHLKKMNASKDTLRSHYYSLIASLSTDGFSQLIDTMTGSVVVMMWSGEDALKGGSKLINTIVLEHGPLRNGPSTRSTALLRQDGRGPTGFSISGSEIEADRAFNTWFRSNQIDH